MSAVESNFPQIGAPGNSLVACMPLTGLSVNEDNFLPEMRDVTNGAKLIHPSG